MSVTAYFARHKNLWEEADDFRSIPGCECVKYECGLGVVRQQREEDRVTKFLRGLGEQYSTVKSQVMLMDEFPSVNKILSMITQQERQLFSFDNALDTKILSGHMVDNCYKKHGYPLNFKPRFDKKNHVLNCMTAADASEDDNDNLSVHQLKHKPWVIDIGATDHVSYFLADFKNYFKIDPIVIRLPNGALTTSCIMGTIVFSDDLYLTNALFIRTFNFKLISVSKLTASLYCKMSFTYKDCEI
ncbi:uncharacterized protein [Arachis hypogaea]|uniref:uncharacterized protein n=1 Tax=Arachis hypogaea TaxID=3818 RepID=UPI003B21CEE6